MLRNTLNTFITATLIMLLGVSSSAKAIVPAGDLMGKTSVTFFGKDPEVRDAAVNVPLVPSAPEITRIEGDEIGEWIIEVTKPREITYAVTATANGPDKYSLAVEYTEASKNIDLSPLAPPSPDELDLGATAAIRIDDRTITVPYDKERGLEYSVNGISEGETVVIGGTSYPVASVTNSPNLEDPTADPTATILLGGDIPAPDISVGTPITEQRTFTVTVSNVALAEEDEGTAGIKITATSVKDGQKKSERSFEFVVLAPVEPSFEKYVRNSNVATNPLGDVIIYRAWVEQGFAYEYPPDSETFYFRSQLNDDDARELKENQETKVKADEGDELEYLGVLSAGNQGDQTNIIIEETLSHFVEYVSGSSTLFLDDGPEEGVPLGSVEDCVLQERQWSCRFNEASLTITKNTSAHLTYKVKVIGGVGDDARFTYTGCLLEGDERVNCVPDGTIVADSRGAKFGGGGVVEWWWRHHTLCWGGEGFGFNDRVDTVEGAWVVGPVRSLQRDAEWQTYLRNRIIKYPSIRFMNPPGTVFMRTDWAGDDFVDRDIDPTCVGELGKAARDTPPFSG